MKEKSRRKTDFYPDYWYRCQQRWELLQCFLLPSFLLVWWKYPKQEDVVLEADQEALEVCGSKSKIKYTPFKATSARSPVIVSQTKLGSRSSAFNKFVFAHAVHRYEFSSAPVCRQGYPMYRSYVSIPGERERLLDDKGNLCLDTSAGSQLGWLENHYEVQKWRNENTIRINNTVSLEDIRRHQGSRLRSCKSRSLQHLDCYWNNL